MNTYLFTYVMCLVCTILQQSDYCPTMCVVAVSDTARVKHRCNAESVHLITRVDIAVYTVGQETIREIIASNLAKNKSFCRQ